ncbi:MAG: dienelactone hydrolase family protein [Hyphomonadaceae bacterium]|nr:dienelactone hydrolase family protein [Hyphomonadaceae bacterium]
MHRLAIGLLAVMVLAFTPFASAKETLQQRIGALLSGSQLILPEGEGPFPVVIQMHGCGGVKKLQGRWAPVARDAGWAVLILDSYAHRKINTLQAYATVCTGMRLWGRERAGDLYAAMEWVRQQNWADHDRIVAAGWSHGGWTVLDAMALAPGAEMESATRLTGLPEEPLKGLVGAFVIYPFTGPGALAPSRGVRVDVPIKALVGTADVVVGNTSVERALARMKMPTAPVEIVMMQGATHAFDEIEAQDMRVRYDPVLTEQAQQMYAGFLKKVGALKSKIGAEPSAKSATAPISPGG